MKQLTAAVIVAAGSSRRMQGICQDKLLLSIAGIPVLARTLINYQNAHSIDEIYVVTRPELFETVEGFAKTYGISKFRGCTAGGATRQHSVQNGVALCKTAHTVAIADGARPFTKSDDIDRVTLAAKKHGGAVLCVPAKDTVKILSADGFIDCTPPRSTLMLAQTPQTFRRQEFADLIARSIEENQAVTDDASIFEIYDKKVMPVVGNYDNIKITTQEDIALAETIAGKETL